MAALLGKTLTELDGMPRDEWLGWRAYWQLEPWGCLPADQRAEQQLQLAFAIGTKPNTPIPTFIDRDPAPVVKADQTPEELEQDIRSFFGSMNTVKVAAEPKPKRGQNRPRSQFSISNQKSYGER